MKEWRVVFVLLAIVILLGVLLGVKIINNTPEKQVSELNNSYNVSNNINNKININENDEAEEILSQYFDRLKNNQIKEEKIERNFEKISEISTWVIIFSSYVIFKKMGIDSELIKQTAILNIAMLLPLIGAIAMILWLVFYIRLLLEFGKEARITTIMCFLPFVIQWRVGTYFGKGTLFKLGLIFLPIIFFPILAFTAKE